MIAPNANHFIPFGKRMPYHIFPKLAGGSNDTNLLHILMLISL